MRNAYLEALYSLAGKDSNVLGLISDNGAIVYDAFRRDYPNQYINMGIAEANMVAAAAGMASCGKIPFAYTIGSFLAYRAFEFIRNDVCLQKQNVKLVGIGAGFAYSTLGPTHHTTEDIAALRALPNLVVICPASPLEAKKATFAAYEHQGPVYLRLGTNKEPEVYAADYSFEIGKAVILHEGSDITLAGTGSILSDILTVAKLLEKEGIRARVLNFHTLSPFDRDAVILAANQTNAILSIEEHSITGGLGSAIAETLAENRIAIPFSRMGLHQQFAHDYGPLPRVKSVNGIGIEQVLAKAKSLLK